MANATGGRPVVNHTPNQISYISVLDPNGKLKLRQAVTADGDDGSQYHQGLIVQVKNDGTKGVARITCTQGPTARHRDGPPDGTLTVTISGGSIVDPMSVTYVDDSP